MRKLVVPIVTPFKEDGSVDYGALTRLTRALLDEGADGIFAGGSSAECFLLSAEERKKTLEAVLKGADGAFVMAHVGAIGTALTLDLAKHAERAGASAVSSVPPFYFGFGPENYEAYYFALADSVKLPVAVYYIPGNTGKMGAEFMAKIMNGRDNITAIKYTDSDYYGMQRIKALTGKEIYSGKDECFLSAIAMGADSAIGTTFNFMLKRYRAIADALDGGDLPRAQAEQAKANAVIAAMQAAGDIFHTTKCLLRAKGYDVGGARAPFLPMEKEREEALLSACRPYLDFLE